MKNLHLVSLDSRALLVQPEEFDELTLASPVRRIFTDFKKHKPLVIEADTLASDVLLLMKKTHMNMLVVVDKNNEMIGTISRNELNDQQLLIKQQQGFDRFLMVVRDLMIPRKNMKGLDYHLLDSINIGELVEVLNDEGMQHCLVIHSESKQIRGVISVREISRRLHVSIDINMENTFGNIFEAVNESKHNLHGV